MVRRKIVVLLCTVGFIIHSLACVYKEFDSPKEAIDVFPVSLSSIDFPLLFGISINPGVPKLSSDWDWDLRLGTWDLKPGTWNLGNGNREYPQSQEMTVKCPVL